MKTMGGKSALKMSDLFLILRKGFRTEEISKPKSTSSWIKREWNKDYEVSH
jgi:hypothetical protein